MMKILNWLNKTTFEVFPDQWSVILEEEYSSFWIPSQEVNSAEATKLNEVQ